MQQPRRWKICIWMDWGSGAFCLDEKNKLTPCMRNTSHDGNFGRDHLDKSYARAMSNINLFCLQLVRLYVRYGIRETRFYRLICWLSVVVLRMLVIWVEDLLQPTVCCLVCVSDVREQRNSKEYTLATISSIIKPNSNLVEDANKSIDFRLFYKINLHNENTVIQ